MIWNAILIKSNQNGIYRKLSYFFSSLLKIKSKRIIEPNEKIPNPKKIALHSP